MTQIRGCGPRRGRDEQEDIGATRRAMRVLADEFDAEPGREWEELIHDPKVRARIGRLIGNSVPPYLKTKYFTGEADLSIHFPRS